jgi:hypothetical protein
MSGAHRARGVDWRDERGAVGGIEVSPFGVLVFVVGTLLVANAWAVIDAKGAALSAAREATRTYVESSDPATALDDATTAAREAIEAHGRDPDKLLLEGPTSGGDLQRCAPVTFTASYPVPAIALPWIGGFGTDFTVRAAVTQVVDPYRDGVPGEVRCG